MRFAQHSKTEFKKISMRLHNLIPNKTDSKKNKKRIGRGRGSGHGKTATRGHKGQKARSGGSIPIGFEGGQMPLYRTLPHRGFNNARFKTHYAVVNLDQLTKIDSSSEIIDRATLIQAGLIRKNTGLIKILGNGTLEKPIKVKANRFSTTAKTKIQEAGGEAITE
jgi:large subunit ribosomal protein L15